MNYSHPKVLLKSKLILCHGSELRQNQKVKLEKKVQMNGNMFVDMDLKDQIHKIKNAKAGGSCDIDDPECEACGS